MAKFDNVRKGQELWEVTRGKCRVVDVIKDEKLLEIGFVDGSVCCYTFDGFFNSTDKYPRLYWNKIHLLTDEEDKPPFDLKKFLKDNLKFEEFKAGKENYRLHYNHEMRSWYTSYARVAEIFDCKCFSEGIIQKLAEVLNENRVTMQQFRKAIQELEEL